MLPMNENVACGRANGTRAYAKSILLKANAQPVFFAIANRKVQAVLAEDVLSIKLVYVNEIELKPKQHFFRVQYSLMSEFEHVLPKSYAPEMKAIQLPIILNCATTGHKMQGCIEESLFVHRWYYKQNLAYSLLWTRHKLDRELSKYEVPQKYTIMIT